MYTNVLQGTSLKVNVHWSGISDRNDEKFYWNRVLYAYLHPVTNVILNIGKAFYQTVQERFDDESKLSFWEWANRNGVTKVRVLVGVVETNSNRLTDQMVSDVESLLIHRIKPRGNVQNVLSRSLSRPGMKVLCYGRDWPLVQRLFEDLSVAPPLAFRLPSPEW